MSTLTKAFVVLVTVLSVLLVALVVSFVARTQNLGGQLDTARIELDAARKIAATRQSELGALQEKSSQRVAQLNAQINTLAGQVNALQADLDTAQSETLTERARLGGMEASLAQLTAASAQTSELLETVNQELQQRRAEAVSQQTKLIESADRIAELEGQLDSLTRQVRRFSERMVALQERNQALESQFAQIPEDVRQQIPGLGSDQAQGPVQPEHAIAGQVTQVQDAGGETLVQVNVGRNDGVKANTQFMVHRGEEFLGNLLVETVDTNAAIGRMTLVQGQVQPGDQVYVGGY